MSFSGNPRETTTYIFNLNIAGVTCAIRIPVIDTCLSSCGAPNIHNPNLSYGRMRDQDGNEYRTVQIGSQEWMAENLLTDHYRNGDPIPIETDDSSWNVLQIGASCWMANDSARFHCPYGKLYNAFALEDSRSICPTGWHIPSAAEWNILENNLGGMDSAGGKLMSISLDWGVRTNRNNSSGWSALPGGMRIAAPGGIQISGPDFRDQAQKGYWWTSTTNSGGTQNTYRVLDTSNTQLLSGSYNKTYGLSVRCIKD